MTITKANIEQEVARFTGGISFSHLETVFGVGEKKGRQVRLGRILVTLEDEGKIIITDTLIYHSAFAKSIKEKE